MQIRRITTPPPTLDRSLVCSTLVYLCLLSHSDLFADYIEVSYGIRIQGKVTVDWIKNQMWVVSSSSLIHNRTPQPLRWWRF